MKIVHRIHCLNIVKKIIKVLCGWMNAEKKKKKKFKNSKNNLKLKLKDTNLIDKIFKLKLTRTSLELKIS
jgi:hypothetical protein